MRGSESRSNTQQRIVLVVASVVLLSTVVGATALTGVASSTSSASASPHDNGIGTNYTVSLPNEKSHQPGATSADIRHYSSANGLFQETSSPKGFKRMDTLTIYSQDITFGTCSTENTKAFGIDRDNDNDGTKTDEGLLQHRKDSSFNEHSIYVNFFGEGSIAGSPVELHDEDQIVAAQDGCYGMPSEPGWYQINARINGTGFNGNYIDSADQGTIRSHYFYVCDCASEQEAREKLGPPPSEDGGSGDSDDSSDGGGSDGSTATATPAATSSDSGGSTPTATSSDSGGTATATSSSDDGSDSTATATSGGGTGTATATQSDKPGAGTPSGTADGGTATATAGSTTGTATTGGSTGNGSANNGGGGSGGPGGSGQGAASGTPTAGSGPGFGLVAAFAGVIGVAVLAVRRTA